MYNNLLKRTLFPLFPYTFFPFFSYFFHLQIQISAHYGKKWEFFYFENRKFVSLSFHILFSQFLPIPKSKFRCVVGKNGVGPPSSYSQFHRVLRFYQGLLEDIHELGFKIKLLYYQNFITMTPSQSLAMIILKCKYLGH